MLVLSRHLQERIMVGDDVVITVLGLCGDTVRLGIEAPKHTPVHREEVWLQILAVEAANRPGRPRDDDGEARAS